MKRHRYVIVSLATMLLSQTMIFHASAGLVLHYDFEDFDGAAVSDRSGNGNDGLAHSLTPVVNTPYGAAVSFDGISSFIEIAGNASLGLSDATVAAWVKAENLDNMNLFNNGVIFSTEDFNHQNGGYAFAVGSAYAMHMGVRSAMAFGTGISALNVFTPEDIGAWRHLVFTHSYADGLHTARFFIDGEEVYSDSKPGPAPFYSGQSAFVGTNYEGRPRGYSFHREFKGLMADLKVYDHALSDQEIRCLTAARTTLDGIVLHYDFECFDGEMVPDLSANENHGLAVSLVSVPDTPYGSGVYFDGLTSFIETAGNPSLNLSNATVAAWVQAENLQSLINNGVIFSTEDFNHRRGGYAFAIGLGYQMNIGIRSALSSGTGFSALSVLSSPGNGVWRHLAFTHAFEDGEHTATFYIDGLPVWVDSKAGPAPFYDGQPAFVGTNYEGRPRGYSFHREFKGVMADLKVFNRTLSAPEIFELSGQTNPVRVYHASEICWPAEVGKTYRVQFSTDLASGTWVDVGDPVTATNRFQCIFASARNQPSVVIYRVQEVTEE